MPITAEQLLRNIVANAQLHVGVFSAHYTVHPDDINAARLWLSAQREPDRAETLLRATAALLQKQNEAHYVLNLLSETVPYDGTDCDGFCLMEDIKHELESRVRARELDAQAELHPKDS